MFVRAAHELSEDKQTRLKELKIVGLNLKHTNGCNGGNDNTMSYCLDKQSGRKYDENTLNHLKQEVTSSGYQPLLVLMFNHLTCYLLKPLLD